jgi:flagellar hook-length control protein FliK
MSKIGSTTPLLAAQSSSLVPSKSGEAGADAGLFAGIFMLLNTKAGEGAETAGHGFPAMADIMASNNPEDEQSGKERAAEETAAIMAAMIEPMQEIKTARGTAAQIDKDILRKDLDIAIAEDLKSGQAKQGVKPVLHPAMPLHKKLDGLNLLEAETEENTDIQPIAGRKPSGEMATKTAEGLLNPLLKKAVKHARTATTTDAKQTKTDTPAQKSGEEAQILNASQLKADKGIGNAPQRAEMPMPANANGERAPTQTNSASPVDAVQMAGSQSQMSGNNAQTGGGQQGGNGSAAGTGMDSSIEQWADMLDMQEDNWSEMLVRRIDKEFRGGGKGLQIEMSPRHLGRLHITLAQQQEITHIHMRTENSAAAQMLVDAEARLAQMLENSGLKLGMFNSFSEGRGGHAGQQNKNSSAKNGVAGTAGEDGHDRAVSNEKNHETMINITA